MKMLFSKCLLLGLISILNIFTRVVRIAKKSIMGIFLILLVSNLNGSTEVKEDMPIPFSTIGVSAEGSSSIYVNGDVITNTYIEAVRCPIGTGALLTGLPSADTNTKVLIEVDMQPYIDNIRKKTITEQSFPCFMNSMNTEAELLIEAYSSGDMSEYVMKRKGNIKERITSFIDALMPENGEFLDDNIAETLGIDNKRDSFKQALHDLIERSTISVPAPTDVCLRSLSHSYNMVNEAFYLILTKFFEENIFYNQRIADTSIGLISSRKEDFLISLLKYIQES